MSVRKRRPSHAHSPSAIAGALLLAIGLLWLGWIVFVQHGAGQSPNIASWAFLPGAAPTDTPTVQAAPLLAEGITLSQANQTPTLSKQQALLVAQQLEPDAAMQAQSTTASYVLLNYPNLSTPATHTDLNKAPVWMVWYQKIPLQPADASVDPTPFPHSYHDLYVFLDANNGKELLSIWI